MSVPRAGEKRPGCESQPELSRDRVHELEREAGGAVVARPLEEIRADLERVEVRATAVLEELDAIGRKLVAWKRARGLT